jgi:hypothetical protein
MQLSQLHRVSLVMALQSTMTCRAHRHACSVGVAFHDRLPAVATSNIHMGSRIWWDHFVTIASICPETNKSSTSSASPCPMTSSSWSSSTAYIHTMFLCCLNSHLRMWILRKRYANTFTNKKASYLPLCACQLNGLSQIAAIVNVNPHHDLWYMERQIVPTELMSGWSASGTGFFHVVRGF